MADYGNLLLWPSTLRTIQLANKTSHQLVLRNFPQISQCQKVTSIWDELEQDTVSMLNGYCPLQAGFTDHRERGQGRTLREGVDGSLLQLLQQGNCRQDQVNIPITEEAERKRYMYVSWNCIVNGTLQCACDVQHFGDFGTARQIIT